MMNKRFLIPVLVLVGFGLPAGASIVTYCSGTNCGSENNSAFTTDLATNDYSLGSTIVFSAGNGTLSGADYTDSATGILFSDFLGQSLSFSGTALSTPAALSGSNYIQLTIPDTIAAISMSVTAQGGVCLDVYCPSGQTSGFVGFINPNPSATWNVEIGVVVDGNVLEINNFSAAPATQASPTPEVATFILIGSGLIAMRWMRRLPRHFFRTPQPA